MFNCANADPNDKLKHWSDLKRYYVKVTKLLRNQNLISVNSKMQFKLKSDHVIGKF